MADFDLINAPARDASLYLDGYSAGWVAGYVSGVETGRQHERDEAAAIWREAAHIVKTAAECPPRDADADRRRAERSRQWWAERRGEAG